MKTIITQRIDGYDIIVGFDEPVVDQEATKKEIAGIAAILPETRAIEDKADQMKKLYAIRNDLVATARQSFKLGNKRKHAQNMLEIETRGEQIKTLEEELAGLIKKKNEKLKEIWNSKVIYFEPRPGEIIVTDEKAAQLGSLFLSAQNARITANGEAIPDYRGIKYVKDAKIIEIEKLGIIPDGELIDNITPEVMETIRISGMSASEKLAEKNSIMEGLAGYAATMRSRLEIQGDEQALTKAKTWYNAEVAKLTALYG